MEKDNTYRKLEKDFAAIRDERGTQANTANRIGSAFLSLLSYIGSAAFLRKDVPDTAEQVITFLKGIVAKAVSYFQGIVNKGDIKNNGDITNTGNISNAGDITNSGNIMTKNLTVTGKATFFELEIQKAKAAGGMSVNSAGSFHIDAVKETEDGFVCYQRAEKDGVKLSQTCEVSDQMMCSNGMNILEGGKGNHFYWRKATEAPKKVVTHTIDGKEEKCLKLVLSKTDHSKNTVDIPQVGDDLVQIGNPDNKERQSVMMSCAYNSFDPELKPSYWAHYMGVNDYDISKHRYTWFAANGSQVTGNFKVQSADGGLESIEDYVKGLAGGKNTVVWHVAFSIRSITGKQGETFRLKYGRTEGENTTWYDDNPDYHGFKQLYAVIIDGATGNERQFMRLGEDYNVADFFTGGSLTVRMMNSYNKGEILAQDTIYPEAKQGKDGKDAVSYKLIPLSENALAYITEDTEDTEKTEKKKKAKMVDIRLVYKIQKVIGEQVNFTTLEAEGMTLTIQPSVGNGVAFTYDIDEYSLSASITYEEIPDNSYTVTLKKGGDIVDQRIVPITFKPKMVFDIDTVNGTITSQIEAVNGNINSIERNIEKTSSTVGNLQKNFTLIEQTSKELKLTVNNGTRPNLLWGSDLNLDGVDITDKAAIEKHLGVVISGDMEIGNREMFQYLKGEGVGGSDAIRFKNAYKREGWAKWTSIIWHDVSLKPHTKYTISVWVKFKSYGRKGKMYVDCNSDDGRWNFGGYLHSEHHYSHEDIDEWTRVKYVFYSGESRKIKDLYLACIADEREGAQCELWLCRPKLEEGDTATPWCAYDGTVEALLASGLDIKEKKFTATADNFVVQNNKGGRTFMVDENGHINANLISAESITAQKISQPFVKQNSFGRLMSSPSLSWYITNGDNINNGYILASELNGAVLNIYNYDTNTIWFYSTFATGRNVFPSKTVNVRVEIEPGAMFRAFGVPIEGVEMNTHNGTTTLVALVPLVPMEITERLGDVRARYTGVVKGYLTIK